MNINDEIKELKQRIAELEELAKEEQEFPQDGEEYWYVDDEGNTFNEKWDGLDFEEYRLAIGGIFKTKDQAQFAVERLKVEAELRKFSRPFKGDNQNYCIELCSPYTTVTTYAYEQYQVQGVIYFDSKEKAKQAIESVGEERIKKHIFNVED